MIKSNLIIRTEIPKPKGKGLASILDSLNVLDDKLTKLTQKPYEINVHLVVHNDELKKAMAGGGYAATGSPEVMPVSLPKIPASSQLQPNAGGQLHPTQTGHQVSTHIDPVTGEQTQRITATSQAVNADTAYLARSSENNKTESFGYIEAQEKIKKAEREARNAARDKLNAPERDEQEWQDKIDSIRKQTEQIRSKTYGPLAQAENERINAQRRRDAGKSTAEELENENRKREENLVLEERFALLQDKNAAKNKKNILEEEEARSKMLNKASHETQRESDIHARESIGGVMSAMDRGEKRNKDSIARNKKAAADAKQADIIGEERFALLQDKNAAKNKKNILEEEEARSKMLNKASHETQKESDIHARESIGGVMSAMDKGEKRNKDLIEKNKKIAADAKQADIANEEEFAFLQDRNATKRNERSKREGEARARRAKKDTEANRKADATNEERFGLLQDSNRSKVVSIEEIAERRKELESLGFKLNSTVTQTNVATGKSGNVYEYMKIAGDAVKGYQVQIETLNEAQGKITATTHEGAKALRYMGDTFQGAAAKVMIWTVATTAIFGTIHALKQAVHVSKELEIGTVTMAQVSRGLGDSFDKRTVAANRMTASIVELETHIGGSAVEAQEAAETFLKAGQTEQEAMTSTRTAILASELSGESLKETSEYLEAAQIQFGLTANQTAGILNSMNVLTLNYRVSLEDLLKATSVAGGVFSEYNSRVEDLSATVAVLAQSTGISGLQIGNALKTIQSRIDTMDVKQDVFERMGMSFNNAAGEIKPLNQIISELSLHWNDLSNEEQRELSVSIAGRRNRNIFNSYMKQSEEILNATSLAYGSSTTAAETFSQRSGTLEVSLGRLRATLISLAYSASGTLGESFKVVVNVLNGLLRLLNDTGAIKLLSLAGIFYIVNMAVRYVSTSVVGLTKSFAALVVSTTGSIVASMAHKDAINKETIAMVESAIAAREKRLGIERLIATEMTEASVAAASATVTTIATVGLNVAVAILTLGVMGLSYAYSKKVKTDLDNIESTKNQVELLDQQINQNQRVVDSIQQETEHVIDLINARDRLRDSRKKGTAESQEELSLNERIQYHGNKLGANISNLEAGGEEARIEAMRVAKLKAEKGLAPTERGMNLFQLKDEVLRDAASPQLAKVNELTAKINALTKESEIATETRGYEIYDAVKVLNDELEKAKATYDATTKSIDENSKAYEEEKTHVSALSAAIKANTDFTMENEKAEKVVEQNRTFAITRKYEVGAEKSVGKVAGMDELTQQRREAIQVGGQLRQMSESFNKLPASGQEAREGMRQDIIKLAEAFAILNNEVSVGVSQQRIAFLTGAAKAEMKMSEAFMMRNVSMARSKAYAPPETQQLDVIKAKQDFLVSEIDHQNEVSKHAASSEEFTAARLREQELFTELGDSEVDRARIMLELEAKIADERRRSADEAMRALGTMSEEDKLRTRAMGAYFLENPNKKVSVEEQFFASADTNKAAQFFGSRLQHFNPLDPANRNNTSMNQMVAAGFGESYNLAQSQRALNAERGGRDDMTIRNEALRNRNRLTEQGGILGGQHIEGLANTANNFGVAGLVRPNMDINISNINLAPMVKIFQETTSKLVESAIDNQLKALWDYARNLYNTVHMRGPMRGAKQ